MVDTLVSTINRHLIADVPGVADKFGKPATSHGFLSRPKNPTPEEMRFVAGRFVRSVARIYVAMSLELTADHKKKKKYVSLYISLLFHQCRPCFGEWYLFPCLSPMFLYSFT